MRKLPIVLSLGLMAFASGTASASNDFYVAGAGAQSCGAYLKDRSDRIDGLDRMYLSWLQGFLSGMNTYVVESTAGRSRAIPDGPTLMAYVDKHCRDNPLHSVQRAAIYLYSDLSYP